MRFAALLCFALLVPCACRTKDKQQLAKSVDQLTVDLSDPSPEVREKACRELGLRGHDSFSARDELEKLAEEDPNEDVRTAAQRAIGRINEAVEAEDVAGRTPEPEAAADKSD